MINFKDRASLEELFTWQDDTPLYYVLAEHYLAEKDLEHARGVSEVGLDQDPDSPEGNYVLSRIAMEENNLVEAEHCLLRAVNRHSILPKALILLLKIQQVLGRGAKPIKQTAEKLLRIYPDNQDYQRLAAGKIFGPENESDAAIPPSPSAPVTKPLADLEETVEKVDDITEKAGKTEISDTVPEATVDSAPVMKSPLTARITISERMATFTLAKVFKKQGNFLQALDILDMLERKGEDLQRIHKERAEIQNLLQQEEQEIKNEHSN